MKPFLATVVIGVLFMQTSAFAGDTAYGINEGTGTGSTSQPSGSTSENTSPPPAWGSNSSNYGMEAPATTNGETDTNYSFDWQSSKTTAKTPSSYRSDEIKKVESVEEKNKMRQAQYEDYKQDATVSAMAPVVASTGKNTGIGDAITGPAVLTKTTVASDEKIPAQLASTTAPDQVKAATLIGKTEYKDTATNAAKIISNFNFGK